MYQWYYEFRGRHLSGGDLSYVGMAKLVNANSHSESTVLGDLLNNKFKLSDHKINTALVSSGLAAY